MIWIDSAVLDFTEWCCRRFQVLTGRTNVWLALQLTNLSIIVYFVWAGLYFVSGGLWSRVALVLFCGGLLYLLTQTVFKEPIEAYENNAYRRVAKGLRNPRRIRDMLLRIPFLTLSVLLLYPVVLIYINLRLPIAILSYSLIVLTTVVLYLLACDPLPPCTGKVKEWLRGLAPARLASSESKLPTVFAVAVLLGGSLSADFHSALGERVAALTRESRWKLVASVLISFKTHHPQGLVKIGDGFILSSVEVRDPARREGVGHLFKMNAAGRLIAAVKLGEGTIYHPGGIDYDGTHVWVPVAEYRPNSRSIVYRVDPHTMKATEMFRFADHIGAIVHNTDDHTLHGVSWGSRRFYRWTLDAEGRVSNASAAPEALRTLNTSHYVDYQDCKYVGDRRMLCTGVTEIRRTPESPPFRLGGIELVDLGDGRPLHQVPVLLWTSNGMDMTHNPVWLEPTASGVRGYFVPEDDTSTLYVYEVEAK